MTNSLRQLVEEQAEEYERLKILRRLRYEQSKSILSEFASLDSLEKWLVARQESYKKSKRKARSAQ